MYVINELLSKDMQHCVGTGNKARYINGEAIEYEYVATEEIESKEYNSSD